MLTEQSRQASSCVQIRRELAQEPTVHRHESIAFPLPHIPVSFQWARPKPYPENPQTLGEHLLKRRSERGLLQREAADEIGVNEATYYLWEKDRAFPNARLYGAVVKFLGYDPLPVGESPPERLKRARWLRGLTIRETAKLLGVNESTFGDWEMGRGEPLKHQAVVSRFLEGELPVGSRPRRP